ncbi:MAG TPA: tetratricopeptide repeat protein [Candidatus Sulfotelmatobacter sp.]|jgi:tetratricopeptide (TPR) repeat protein
MGTDRFCASLAMTAVLLGGSCPAFGREMPSSTSGTTQSAQQDGSSSSARRKQTSRHVTIAESDDPSPELTRAEDLIQKQDLAGAEPVLQKMLARDADNYVAWFDLGFVENGLGKSEESIAAYRKSVAANPAIFESNLNLGLQLAKAGNPEATQFLRAATQLKPTSHVAEGQARAWVSLGHVIETDKPDEAVAAYQKAAALVPRDVEPHLGAGAVLEKQNKFADAEQEYKQALQIDPSSMDAVTGLANIYMRGRKFPEAEVQLRKIVAAHPTQAALHIQLARILAAQGKNDAAIAEFEAGLHDRDIAANDSANAQRELAALYYAAGKNEQADAAYRALLVRQPNDPALHHDLGRSLIREKKFPEAQAELLAAIKLRPDLGDAYGDLAFAAGENKDYPLVIRALDVRAKLLPETADSYFFRASAFDHLKDVKKAAANYRLFLQAANGKYPEQEWQAKHRLIALEPKR